ncbi:MAG TPA: YCF48-related protein [Bacteroidia bacterium]|nr:YCF48-related protein [Bacteroidia bacterium]
MQKNRFFLRTRKSFLILLLFIFGSNFSDAQNWNWQNPLPQGSNLYSVYFTNANTGYTVGLDGKILKTNDAGNSWNIQNSGTLNSLQSVHFPTIDTGYAVGASSTLFKTTDGGSTWNALNIGAPYLTSVFFTNANTGYAVGSNGSSAIIIKTIDGGLNWTAQNTTAVTYYNAVYFCNDTTGYVVGNGGRIFKTTNAGNTWTQQISGVTTSLFSVYFTDENHGYVGDYGRILRTTDGGVTWTYQTIFQSYEQYGIYFTDNNTGYAVGRSGKILKTINAGVSWAFLNSGTSINLRSVYFTDLNTGYAVGESGIMLKTTDAGITWNSFTPISYFEKLNDAKFPSSCTGYAVGDFGKILKTVNGGTNWIEQNSGLNKNLNAVFFTDDNTGYAVADSGKIIKTIDGGTNWFTQNSGLFTQLNSVFFTNTDTGYAAGINGKILKTVDGGINWILLNNNDSQSLYSIYFVDDQIGFAAGNSGRVLKTIDAGATWNILYTATTLDLKSIYFVNATTGYLCGVSGHIRKTTNGGTNWMQLTNNINIALHSISFLDANNGYAVGYDYNDYGKIYHTSNGGTNWSVETISWEHEFFSVNYVDSNSVYVVGNNGAILKSILGDISASNNGPICEGAPLTLTASTIAGASYLWTGPNGFSSSQQNPTLTATTAMSGSYTVAASINLCTNLSQTTIVEVVSIPTALAQSNNGPVCEGTPLELNAASIAGATYSWTGPNGFTSSQQNPTVAGIAIPAMTGNYTVTATVNGCTSLPDTTIVLVNITPTGILPDSNGPVCEGTSLDLSAATIAGATYNWTGPNGFTSVQQNPTVTAIANAAMTGTYQVTVTVDGCTSLAETTTVTVNPIPAAPVASNNGPICENTALNLVASTIPGATYNWTGPNGFTSVQQNPTVAAIAIAAMTGTYQVTVTVDGCISLAENTVATVNPVPTAPIINNNGPVDEGDTLTLSASTIVGANYLWIGPDGFNSTQQNPTVSNSTTLAMAGNYYVTVTVNGCTSNADSTLVIVNTTVGARNRLYENNISIFPNPASDQLYVNYYGEKSIAITIYNNLGAIVLQGSLYSGSNLFDVSAFANGIYTIRFTDTDGSFYQKLVKN